MQGSKASTALRPIKLSTGWVQDQDARWRGLIAGGMLVLVPLGAVLLWAMSLDTVNVREMNDLGLVSVLPVSYFASVLLLTVSFCLALRQRPLCLPIVVLHIGILILMLYGTPALVEDTPRFEATWKHLGIVDYIIKYESIDTSINAYFNWPGFFILAAFLTQAMGYESLVDLVAWAHVFFNLLYLVPLVMIFGAITRDHRLVWLGAWFFYLANWAGQDYFAPQAFAYFLYLVILGGLLMWFKATTGGPTLAGSMLARGRKAVPQLAPVAAFVTRCDLENASSTPWQRMGLITIVVAAFATIVPSHQLTPVAAVVAVGALVAFSRITPRSLVILMAVMTAAWMFFMAVPYFHGHLESHLGSVGQVDQNINQGVASRVEGSPDHIFVVRSRIALTIAVGALAMAGGLRRLWTGYWDVTPALLVVAPMFLIALQGYGGEMLIRVFFFMLPGLAFLAAALFFTRPGAQTPWRVSLSIGLVSMALLGGFLLARYGNERMDFYTTEEVAAVQYLYNTAEPGSRLIAGAGSVPWRYEDPTKFKHAFINRDIIQDTDVDTMAGAMLAAQENGRKAYILITRSTKANVDLFFGLGPGALDRFEEELKDSNRFEMIFANEDASIFVLADDADTADLQRDLAYGHKGPW